MERRSCRTDRTTSKEEGRQREQEQHPLSHATTNTPTSITSITITTTSISIATISTIIIFNKSFTHIVGNPLVGFRCWWFGRIPDNTYYQLPAVEPSRHSSNYGRGNSKNDVACCIGTFNIPSTELVL